MTQTVLAFDTATDICSVALFNKNTFIFENRTTPQTHANELLGMIKDLMNQAGIHASELDAVLVGEGPGAFTGVRIAAGVAQGLALGWEKPTQTMSSLASMAFDYVHHNEIKTDIVFVCCLDARMKELYSQTVEYKHSSNEWFIASPELTSPEVLKLNIEGLQDIHSNVIGLGDCAIEYPQIIQTFNEWQDSKPSALGMIQNYLQLDLQAELIEDSIPQPLYLRNKIAETIEERNAKKAAK